jgi:hypothetical protein
MATASSTTTTTTTTGQIKNNSAYYFVNVYLLGLLFHVSGPLIPKLFAKSCKHSCNRVKSYDELSNSKLVTSSDLSNKTSQPLKNSLKSYDDFTITITMHLIIAMSTPTSDCNTTIAKCIKIRPKSSKFSRFTEILQKISSKIGKIELPNPLSNPRSDAHKPRYQRIPKSP